MSLFFLQNLLSSIRIRIQKNFWIRISKKWMRIHSPASSFDLLTKFTLIRGGYFNKITAADLLAY